MKNILFILLLLSVSLHAAIDECKTDIYFANGIGTSSELAQSHVEKILEPAIRKEFYQNEEEMKRRIGKVALSYNQQLILE